MLCTLKGEIMSIRISGFADEIAQELNTQVIALKKLGISYVEMRGVDGNNLINHDDDKVKEIKSVLDANGIKLSALGSPLGKIGIRDEFEPHFEAYKRAVEIAHIMECPNIRMFSFYIPKDSSPEDCKEEVFERIGSFVDYASANGAVLLHENEKGIYGEKAAECRKLMEAFYGDSFKAVFDFANFVQAGEDTLKAYDLLKQYVAYFHVKDALKADGSVVPAGFGDGNVAEILKDSINGGYDGYLSLEPHLFDFTGFAGLEKGGKHPDYDRKLNGEEAFTLAYKALDEILKKI